MKALSDNMRGAIFMMVSMAGFSINDALMKLTLADLPLFQAVFLRGVLASALIGLMCLRSGAFRSTLHGADWRVIGLRLIGEIGGTVCFLTAIVYIPLANATAILQAAPLAVTLAAALLFGEKVGWQRYVAIAVGFCGVLMVVQPGAEGFSRYSFWALVSIVFIVLRDLATRRLAPATPTLLVSFITALTVTLTGGLITLFGEWRPVQVPNLLSLGGAAGCVIFGYIFGVKAMRIGEIGFVTPFRYSVMIWALLLGYLIFGDWPRPLTMAGAAVLVATGIYTLTTQRRTR